MLLEQRQETQGEGRVVSRNVKRDQVLGEVKVPVFGRVVLHCVTQISSARTTPDDIIFRADLTQSMI